MLDDGGEIAGIAGQKPSTLCSDVDPTPCGCVLDGWRMQHVGAWSEQMRAGWKMREHGGCHDARDGGQWLMPM